MGTRPNAFLPRRSAPHGATAGPPASGTIHTQQGQCGAGMRGGVPSAMGKRQGSASQQLDDDVSTEARFG